MRFFIAINFDDTIKQKIASIQNQINELSQSGKWTSYENLHLTLSFIGEVDSCCKDKIIKLLDSIEIKEFDIKVKGVGRFQTKGKGDMIWLRVENNVYLQSLHNNITKGLKGINCSLDSKKFKPHITLGRQVIIDKKYPQDTPDISIRINRVDLMLSERIDGVLRYTVLYSKKFETIL